MKIKISLNNANSIKSAIKELEAYRDSLHGKCQAFVSKLADVGIQTAQANAGEYGNFILFDKEIEDTAKGVKGIMYAWDGQKIIREWRYRGDMKRAEVSPLLMAEFGSGWKAKVLDNVEGVGQGTFPGQKHAFSPFGWWWTDRNPIGGVDVGNGWYRHHSRGEAPTFPMHSAMLAMIFEMETVAKEVFGNG